MSKRLAPEKFKQYLPEGVNAGDITAFETISINTLPVNKRNIFEGAVHTKQTLLDMEAYVNAGKHHVPLHTDHDQGYALPIGKTFFGKVLSDDSRNYSELRSFFYLPNTEAALIAKIETDVISEVSVGVRYKALNCSDCGWDYLGPDATDENIWNRTCGNDHQIGVDGNHLMLNGLDRWMEQSLVSLGAASGSKIVAKTQALLGLETYNKLAASGRNPSATTLYSSATKEDPMDLKELVTELTDTKVKLAGVETALTASQLRVKELEPLVQKVAELTAANTALAPVAEITSQRDAALAFTRKEADRLAVIAGEPVLKADATLTELTASIESNRLKAADKFAAGSRADPVGTTRSDSDSAQNTSIYKTAR